MIVFGVSVQRVYTAAGKPTGWWLRMADCSTEANTKEEAKSDFRVLLARLKKEAKRD